MVLAETVLRSTERKEDEFVRSLSRFISGNFKGLHR